MASNRLLGFAVALASISSAAGCASAEIVPVSVTATTGAQIAAPAAKESASDPLKRDADLTGNEHKISLLEGRLIGKLHAITTPKMETSSSPTKGILYTTIEAKLGDPGQGEQTVHCAAYGEQLWPGGIAAADLRGEHDWANDESEKSDVKAKTKTEITQTDVTVLNGRPVITGRGTVRDESNEIVADRKVVVMQGASFTLLCSDRTIGFDKRFHAFVNELLGSLKLDPSPAVTPRRVAIYKTTAEGKTVGYYQVATYAEAKGVLRTYRSEVALIGVKGEIAGLDVVVTSTTNARSEETDLHMQGVLNNTTLHTLGATRDAKGWSVRAGGIGGIELPAKRLPAKTAIMTQLSPAWLARMQSVASKKVPSAKIPLLDLTTGALAIVVAKRQADGSVSYQDAGKELKTTLDAEGVTTLQGPEAKYERIFVEGTK